MSTTNHDTDTRTETETESESNAGHEPKPDSEHSGQPDSETRIDEAAQTDGTTQAEEAVQELPPSAKLVYKVLEYDGAMTQEEIATESRLCPRTVRYALGKLDDSGLVSSRVHLEDARQSVYRIGE